MLVQLFEVHFKLQSLTLPYMQSHTRHYRHTPRREKFAGAGQGFMVAVALDRVVPLPTRTAVVLEADQLATEERA